LAQALRELVNRNNEIKIIGTRHDEKLYDSLVSREEMARCEDLGSYYRIPADSCDLNCNRHFVDGETQISRADEQNVHAIHGRDLIDAIDGFLILNL
jgi:UDP-glucose 4-epimerase